MLTNVFLHVRDPAVASHHPAEVRLDDLLREQTAQYRGDMDQRLHEEVAKRLELHVPRGPRPPSPGIPWALLQWRIMRLTF